MCSVFQRNSEASCLSAWGEFGAICSVFEMMVQVLVLVALHLVSLTGSLLMRPIQVRLAHGVGTDRAKRNQLFQVRLLANGTFRGWRSWQNQGLETVPATAARVIIHRHERSLSEGGTKRKGEMALGKKSCKFLVFL